LRKKRPGEEINIKTLPKSAQERFLGPTGSRVKEWKAVQALDSNGMPSIRIFRGKEAQKLREQYPDRFVPSRWHEKWKDFGDGHDNGLRLPEVPKHLDAKSRWILQGFHDPDIHLLNRSVPTPATSDVPLSMQMVSSLRARAWIADVSSAFSQGIKGQRSQRLFATPPPGGIPGEDDDIVIEILAELYGLITGPPAWRKSVLTTLVELGFKRHPLAPCVAIMYENLGGKEMQLSGLIVLETDDFSAVV